MPERRVVAARGKEVSDYRREAETRLNNPTAALAREDVAPIPERRFSSDPHLDPHLTWAWKADRRRGQSMTASKRWPLRQQITAASMGHRWRWSVNRRIP
jgi:hypothetical protein